MGYLTLVGEMAKRNITNESIANLLGIHRNSVYNKLRGITSFSVEEAVVIRDEFFPGSDIDELFEKEEKKAGSMRDSPSESTKQCAVIKKNDIARNDAIPCLLIHR